MNALHHCRFLWLTLLILLLFGAGVTRLGAAGDAKKLHVFAMRIVSEKDKTNEKIRITTLTKAKVTQDDATFTAATIVMRSEDDVHEFTCTGAPVFTDPETKITAEKLVAYSSPRRAEFSGNVTMVSTPKKKAKNGSDSEFKGKLQGEPTTLTADTLSYDYANKLGAAKGNVVVVQKTRTVWADEGYYDQQLEKIQLKGNVRMKNTGSDELKELKDAETVTVSLENDWIDIQAKDGGLVAMDVEYRDKDQDKDKGKPRNDDKGQANAPASAPAKQ